MNEKGVYLVTEKGVMNPTTGAYRHITVGMEQLSSYYNMRLISPTVKSGLAAGASKKYPNNHRKVTVTRGAVTDILTFFRNLKDFFSLYRKVKSDKPDFIYERISYLNYNGLIISKLLGIKHFYELNGIPHYAIRNYYKSLLNPVVKRLDKLSIQFSNFNFIVGSWNQVLQLSGNNWKNIENGIEDEYLDYFADKSMRLAGPCINFVFIGHLMRNNHRPDLLMKALKILEKKECVRLNLIGSNLQIIEHFCLENGIEVVNHGFLNREELMEVMQMMHVGLIPGGEEYPSFMKIFEYGAGKCLVIASELYNLKYWFSDKEVYFFKKNDAGDLKNAIEDVINNPQLIESYGNNIYNTINGKFTWKHIFTEVKHVIDTHLK